MTLKTRYGTSVEFDEIIPEFVVVKYNGTKVRLSELDLDENSRKEIEELKKSSELICK